MKQIDLFMILLNIYNLCQTLLSEGLYDLISVADFVSVL